MERFNPQAWAWLALLLACFAVAPSGEYNNLVAMILYLLRQCACARCRLLLFTSAGDTASGPLHELVPVSTYVAHNTAGNDINTLLVDYYIVRPAGAAAKAAAAAAMAACSPRMLPMPSL
jgi:hypothetical protein